MSRIFKLLGILLGVFALSGAPETASAAVYSQVRYAKHSADKSDSRNQTLQRNTEKKTIMFRPPIRGAPTRRIGGSSRAPGVPSVSVVVFAPETTGLTIHAQPSLYWFISKNIDKPIEFTLIDPKAIQPVLRTALGGPHDAGVHEFSLLKHGVHLRRNIDYEWAVALVFDSRKRSRDVVSSGTIRRIEPARGVANRVTRLSETARTDFYAQNGLWYDAIAEVSQAIARHPDDHSLREQRASLLRHVGLSDYVDLVDGR